ncbi:MAG TPA: hypothetical protein VF677_16310, partial [Flavobacterium sp.]
MKNKLFTLSVLMSVFMSSCSDSASDEFDDANGNANARYIKTITSISPSDGSNTITVNYNASGKVTNMSTGTKSTNFAYENDNLTNVTGDIDPLQISQLYQAPYEAYDFGQVLVYDAKKNPAEIKLFNENIHGVKEEFSASITYDTAPNSFFHTLKAAGIIDVLDKVKLNLNMQSMPKQIVQARVLLPVNNPTKVVIKNVRGATLSTTSISY